LEHTLLPASSAVYYLDMGRLKGSDAVILSRQLQAMLCHDLSLDSSVGLSRGKFPALVAARVTRPDSPRLIGPGEEGAFLSSYPVSTLPLKKEMSERLEMFGILTLGAFAKLPGAAVLSQFGKKGLALHQLAQGNDTRPVTSRPRRQSVRLREHLEGGVNNQLVLETLRGTPAYLEMDQVLATDLTLPASMSSAR
jgi:nucleotidyltransferase/DNA polymerase involved in DNA repair